MSLEKGRGGEDGLEAKKVEGKKKKNTAVKWKKGLEVITLILQFICRHGILMVKIRRAY